MSIQNIVGTTLKITDDTGDTITEFGYEGINLIKDALTTPVSTLMSANGFDNNGSVVSFQNLYNLKQATPALRIPLTSNVYVVNDTYEANDDNLAKTRIASLSAIAGNDPVLVLKQDVGGASWIEVDITPTGVQYIDSAGTPINQTWANIIGGVSSIGLGGVLTNSNNAGGQSIINVNDIACSSINSTSYPPPAPSLSSVLTAGNDATNYDINNVNNLNCASINGLTPITLGLTWGDFTSSNAYSNLPNQAYQVYSYPSTTSQYYDRFESYNGSNNYGRLYPSSLEFYDMGSSTTTSYSSNSIQSTNGTDFTITAGSGASTALRLDCSQLIINGVAYSAPPPPPLRWGYYQNSGQYFSIPAGSWYNVGVGSSPIISLSGMTAGGSYTIGIQFSCWIDSAESTGACYLGYSNSNGSWNGNCLYTSGRPCPSLTNGTTFSSPSNTQFTIQDTLIFVAGSSGDLSIDLYLGHNGGTWSGNYYWSFSANILTP
jgi:hypothetical protein